MKYFCHHCRYTVPGAYEIYLYTAFYDARVSLASLPVIRIIAVSEDLKDVPALSCVVNYAADDSQLGVPGVRHVVATSQEIGAGASRHDKEFREYILTCQLKTEHVPVAVGIGLDPESEPDEMIPVENSATRESTPRKGMAVCVSVSYWMIEPYKIVEWMELQRLLGVDRIVVYNNSLAHQSLKVLEHYAKTDYLDLRQSHNFLSDRGEQTFHLHMSPVINDCMYRYMYRYKHIMVIDFDEVIVPHLGDSLVEVLRAIEQQETDYHPARSYVFQNAYFFFNHKPDTSQNIHFRTLKYRVRQELSAVGYSAKSIIDPMSCYAMHNHYCWGVTKLYEVGNYRTFVPPELAFLHHYKRCHLDEFENMRGECNRQLEKGIQDDTMLKYKDRLETAVNRQLAMLGL